MNEISKISKINTLAYLFFTKDKYDNEQFKRIIKNVKIANYTIISSGTEKHCFIKMYIKYANSKHFNLIYYFKEHYERKN